jgi:diacylglycerol kinase family enzyme
MKSSQLIERISKLHSPVSFQIDGEYYGRETELNVVMSPHKLKVAIPNSLLFEGITLLHSILGSK